MIGAPSTTSGRSQRPAAVRRSISSCFQYFINYNIKKGWYITLQPIITANWRASSGNVWTVPVGGGWGES